MPSSALSIPTMRSVFMPSDRLVLHHGGGSAFNNQTANRLAHRQRFDQRHSAEVTAVLAPVATSALVKHRAFGLLEPESLKNLRLRHELLTAVCADAPNETLRAGHDDRARDQE